MDRNSSQSFTEQHQRLGQQHQQAAADAAASYGNANTARPARGQPLQALTSVREEDPAETLAEMQSAEPSQRTPTGTISSTGAAPINIPAGLRRGSGSSSGSGKRASPKAMHYGMSEHSSPMPVLHSPFASVPAGDAAVMGDVDANLLALQEKL